MWAVSERFVFGKALVRTTCSILCMHWHALFCSYTLDGVRFFKTSTALREWCDKATQVLAGWELLLHRDDQDKRMRALRRWRNNVMKMRIAEANRVIKPLPSLVAANTSLAAAPVFPQVVADRFSPSQWHPALGLRLPPLPVITGTEASLSGEVKITDVKRFRQFTKSLAGPLDCGNWLLPPRVLIGGFPWGQARRSGGVKSRGDCVSTLLLRSITVFVCLMPDDELEEAKTKFNFAFEAELAKKHGCVFVMTSERPGNRLHSPMSDSRCISGHISLTCAVVDCYAMQVSVGSNETGFGKCQSQLRPCFRNVQQDTRLC